MSVHGSDTHSNVSHEDDTHQDNIKTNIRSESPLENISIPVPTRTNTPPPGPSAEDRKREKGKSLISTRSTSPTSTPCDITLKIDTQFGRLDTLDVIQQQLTEVTSLEEIDVIQQQAEECHKMFIKEHSYLETRCPPHLMTSNYFKAQCHAVESAKFMKIKMAIVKTRQQFNNTASIFKRQHSHLPTLPLPEFDGDYNSWPEFKSLFTSIVMKNHGLSGIEQLHYLKSSVKGSAADVIANLPMTEATFTTAWEKLVAKYENKRKLIYGQINNIMLEVKTSKHASQSAHLTALVTQIDNALSAIQLLGQSTENWDAIIIHQIIKQLDEVTRERWETVLGDNATMPTYQQLKDFIASRIRTLENLESSSHSHQSSHSNTTSRQTSSSKYNSTKGNVSNITAQQSKYTCDCCGQPHFIVSCTKFRSLSPVDRLEVVKNKALCFNCMGRHSARACRMQMTCTVCHKHHHTMIHAAITAPQPTQQPSQENQ